MIDNKWRSDGRGSYFRYTTFGSESLGLDRTDGIVVSSGAKYTDMPANVNTLVPINTMIEYLEQQGYVVRKENNLIPFRKVKK